MALLVTAVICHLSGAAACLSLLLGLGGMAGIAALAAGLSAIGRLIRRGLSGCLLQRRKRSCKRGGGSHSTAYVR